MPVSIETRPELDLTIFTVTEAATYSELMPVLESFYSEAPTGNVIWDGTRITEIPLSSRELQTIVQFAHKHSNKRPAGNTALIVNSSLNYGMARMASTFAELDAMPRNIEIFKNLNEALKWIKQ